MTDPLFSAFGFYGCIQTLGKLEPVFYWLEEWATTHGFQPDSLGIWGKGFAKSMGNFANRKKRLLGRGFEDAEGLQMEYSHPAIQSNRMPTLKMIVMASSRELNDEAITTITVRRELMTLDDERLQSLARIIINHLKPAYGIGFERQESLGPSLYLIGLIQGLDRWESAQQEKECDSISNWAQVGLAKHVYRHGVLWDIYPLNFVNITHLAKDVGPVTLREWIEHDAKHGTLEKWPEGLWLWTVPSERIREIREALAGTGLLFRRQDWEEPSPPMSREEGLRKMFEIMGYSQEEIEEAIENDRLCSTAKAGPTSPMTAEDEFRTLLHLSGCSQEEVVRATKLALERYGNSSGSFPAMNEEEQMRIMLEARGFTQQRIDSAITQAAQRGLPEGKKRHLD